MSCVAAGAPNERQAPICARPTASSCATASAAGPAPSITALPTVVFVIVNATASLRPAIIAAVATGVALAGYRLARKQSTQQAISGLFGVLIAALIAARTGQARGYFLLGIWTSFLYAVPFAVSVLVRRPLVGLALGVPRPVAARPGRPRPPLVPPRGRCCARTRSRPLIGTALFLARGFVQATLYHDNATGWLAFARVAMGYPLYIAAVGAGYWVVRRVRAPAAAPRHGRARAAGRRAPTRPQPERAVSR